MPDLRHGEDLVRRDERSLLESLARQQDVGDADQAARRQRQRVRQQPDHRRQQQRHPVAVQHGEGLGHRLDDDEVDEGEADRHQRDAEPAERLLGEHRDQHGGAVLHQQHREVDRVQVRRQIAGDLLEQDRVRSSLLPQRDRAHAADARERGLGERQHGADHHQHDDREHERAHRAPRASVRRTNAKLQRRRRGPALWVRIQGRCGDSTPVEPIRSRPCGGSSAAASERVRAAPDAELLHAAAQRARVQVERARGAVRTVDPPAGLAQRGDDVAALDRLERLRLRVVVAACRRERRGRGRCRRRAAGSTRAARAARRPAAARARPRGRAPATGSPRARSRSRARARCPARRRRRSRAMVSRGDARDLAADLRRRSGATK